MVSWPASAVLKTKENGWKYLWAIELTKMKDICKLRPQVGKSCILPSESAAPRTGHKHKQHPQATSEGQYNEHSPEVKGKEYKTGLTDAPNEAIALPFKTTNSCPLCTPEEHTHEHPRTALLTSLVRG